MSIFGSRLKELRISNHLTQTQLAEALGLAFSTISMYERGNREPDFETMEAIADYFNVSMDYLHGLTDDYDRYSMKISSTAKRLKYIMDERHLKQVDILNLCDPFCRKHKIKLAKNDLSQYVSGKVQPGQDKLSILGMALDVNDAWLMGYDVPAQRKKYENSTKKSVQEISSFQVDDKKIVSNVSHIVTGKMRMIPVYESVSAGFGAVANDYIVDYIPLIIDCDAEAEETICIKVTGDSMYPKIEDGDLIVVRKQSSIDSGKVGVFLVDNEDALVKKVTYKPGEPWLDLLSFNPEYPPKHFEGPDVERVQVLGLVKQIVKSI